MKARKQIAAAVLGTAIAGGLIAGAQSGVMAAKAPSATASTTSSASSTPATMRAAGCASSAIFENCILSGIRLESALRLCYNETCFRAQSERLTSNLPKYTQR